VTWFPSGGERAKDHRQVGDGLGRRVRVVDRRGQRLAHDIDQLPDAERGVLLQSALEADPDPGVQHRHERLRIGGRITRRAAPDPRQRRPGHHVFADPRPQPRANPLPGGAGQQPGRTHRLDVPRALRGDWHRPLRHVRASWPPANSPSGITARVLRSTPITIAST
jgi:hypothetical protein